MCEHIAQTIKLKCCIICGEPLMQYHPYTYEELKLMKESAREEMLINLHEVRSNYTHDEQRLIDMDIEKIRAMQEYNKVSNHLMFFLVAISVLLFSCTSARKSYKQVEKAIDNYPVQTSGQFRSHWPTQITSTKTDSSSYMAYIKALEGLVDSMSLINPTIDTLVDVWEDSTKVRVLKNLIVQKDEKQRQTNIYISKLLAQCKERGYITKTITVKDSVDTYYHITQIIRQQKKIENKNLWLKIFAGLAALFAIIVFILSRFLLKNQRNKFL